MLRFSNITPGIHSHFADTNILAWMFGSTPWDIFTSCVLWFVIIFFGYRWIVSPVLDVLGGYRLFWRARRIDMGFLEITPPHHIDKSPLATQQLITVLQSQIGRGGLASLEVVSSRQDGIRYLIRARRHALPAIQRHLASYLPNAKFRVLGVDPSSLIPTLLTPPSTMSANRAITPTRSAPRPS